MSQENTHCLQGQRLEVTVFNYTQGIPGSVTQVFYLVVFMQTPFGSTSFSQIKICFCASVCPWTRICCNPRVGKWFYSASNVTGLR